MRTYTFNIVVEPDEVRWHAYSPALHEKGAATWGHTREEAVRNVEEVVRLVMESMVEHDERLPESLFLSAGASKSGGCVTLRILP